MPETELAWEYLRRMPEYRHDYALWSRLMPDTPEFRALAHKWGLVCSGRSRPFN
ncbi:hypothetical protein K2X14_16180 [Acetobacter sp. TBRC 12305]|uniref:transcriptional regulator domain-containing protein n=1 Tax=Acetobacter garciniae TaxID=2817435 RepID=UPI001C733CCB|nr:hypothetical protein [Acetobacter garciniae]